MKTENYTALNIPRHCRHGLLVKKGWRQGKVLGSDKVIGKNCFEYADKGKRVRGTDVYITQSDYT
jgi:hypothetical protein